MRLCVILVLFACALSDDFSNIDRVRCYSNGPLPLAHRVQLTPAPGLWFNTPKPASGAEWFVAECPVDFFCHTIQYCGPPLSHPACGTIIAGNCSAYNCDAADWCTGCHHVNDPQLTGHGTGCSGLKVAHAQMKILCRTGSVAGLTGDAITAAVRRNNIAQVLR